VQSSASLSRNLVGMDKRRSLSLLLWSTAGVLPVLVPAAFAFQLPVTPFARTSSRSACFSCVQGAVPQFARSLPRTSPRNGHLAFMCSARSPGGTSSDTEEDKMNFKKDSEIQGELTSNTEADKIGFDKDGKFQRAWTLPPVPGVPLQHHTDRYNSAIVEDARLNSSSTSREQFQALLDESMEKWKEANIRAVWIRIATEACELIPVAIKAGFTPHHSAPDHFTMTAWFGKGESRLPPAASHFVGVAGFVLDRVKDKDGKMVNKVLVIQEKSGPAAGIGLWKFPGGLVDPKEDIPQAAEREVFEETGVVADFQRLCSIQENHHVRGPGREGTTDLFCLCYLRPRISGALPAKQEEEIAACAWMPLEEVLALPFFQKGALKEMAAIGQQVAMEEEEGGGQSGFQRKEIEMTFRNGTCSLLHPPTPKAPR